MPRDSSNQKKHDKLGMPYGTANGRLKKNIMFDLVCKLRLNLCFHCKLEITSIAQFSIEHKTPWLNSENPVELFFDLNNIAFSHLVCNVEAAKLTYVGLYLDLTSVSHNQKRAPLQSLRLLRAIPQIQLGPDRLETERSAATLD